MWRDAMPVLVSVIVPAYNEQQLISDCLDSLLVQTITREKFEVILVDNNSTDLTASIASDKGVRVEKELKKGYVHAFRKGIEAGQGEFLAFTDADCRVPPDWLEVILADFSSAPGIVAVGGKASYYDFSPLMDRFFRFFVIFIHALPGNNMAIKREAIDRIGGIDPTINLSLDYWLTVKLRKVGRLKIDNNLFVKASGRRFRNSFYSNIQYFINVISITLTTRPVFFNFPDVREV
jgi:glycosyltransferase involved in cell wall biosynthesis